MTKTITVVAIIGAFILGSVSSISFVEGANPGNEAIVAALDRIVDSINGIQPDVTVNSIEGPQGPPGPQGPQGEQGPPGEKGDGNTTRTIRTVQLEQTGPAIGNKQLMVQNISLDDTANILIDSQIISFTGTGELVDLVLKIDGDIVSRTLTNGPSFQRQPISLSWVGELSSGTHIISIESGDIVPLDQQPSAYCDRHIPESCYINTLIFE